LVDCSRDIENKDNDIIILKKKINDSELINKQLTQELKRNATYIAELEGQMRFLENRADPLGSEGYSQGRSKGLENSQEMMFDEAEGNGKDKVSALQNIIENLKHQVRKERVKNGKILGEVNKVMIDKNKLEKIFIDCVEESRKEIILRKNKENLHKTKNDFNKMPLINSTNNTNDVKYENFLTTDKKRVIENFLLREDVINFLHDHLFSKGVEIPNDKEFGTTRSTFVKTADSKKRNTFYSNAKKTPTTTGFSYQLPTGGQGRAKTPNINILFNK